MNEITNWVLKVTVATLSVIVMGVVAVLMAGLFNHNVNNDQVFDIIGPAFNTVIGAFVGLLGGISLSKNTNKGNDEDKKED